LVIIPSSAPTHIQKMLPAPPSASAAPTPMMLPTPIVPPSAVLTAAKGETLSLDSFLQNSEPSVFCVTRPIFRSGRKCVKTVK